MSPGLFSLVVGAGIAAGLAGSIAGLASLFSYPALLAAGLPATAANVTNTVSLAVGSLSTITSSRPDLAGQAGTARRLGLVCAPGGRPVPGCCWSPRRTCSPGSCRSETPGQPGALGLGGDAPAPPRAGAANLLRFGIALAGIGLAVKLGLDAF